jgi:hypothetical protein
MMTFSGLVTEILFSFSLFTRSRVAVFVGSCKPFVNGLQSPILKMCTFVPVFFKKGLRDILQVLFFVICFKLFFCSNLNIYIYI